MKDKTDRELVLESQENNTLAFGELVKRHHSSLIKDLYGFSRDLADAEDTAQDAFLQAFLKIGTLREPYNFSAWVHQIGRNIARNFCMRGPKYIPVDSEALERLQQSMPVPDKLEDEQRFDRLMIAISNLSTPLRESARLCYLNHYSQQKAAEKLGVPLGTIKRRLWDGRKQMKQEVAKMSIKGRVPDRYALIPQIQVTELPDESLEIASLGPGLYFGGKLIDGHSEVCRFYDYPGGILTMEACTRVIRRTRMIGRECFEVHIEHSECEPRESSVLNYFEPIADGFRWLMQITAHENFPLTRFIEGNDQIFVSRYRSGKHENYQGRVIDLKIGENSYDKCLAVFWSWQDGTPAENIYTRDGREVLHRRYVASDAPASRNYDFSRLDPATAIHFEGKEYRLWYDTILL